MQGIRLGDAGPRRAGRKGRWTRAEVDRLRDLYGLRDDRDIARELGRKPDAVRKMARVVCRAAKRQGPWTAGEVERLKAHLGRTTPDVIALLLGRTPSEVQHQIVELGRIQTNLRWSREEQQRLRRVYGTRGDQDLAAIFGRSVESVQRAARKLCLAKDKAYLRKVAGAGATQMPRWTASELELLREIYPHTCNLDIAQRLKRSVKSVVSKAHHLGLKKELERLREMGRENVRLRHDRRSVS